jgi:hypothetical protein
VVGSRQYTVGRVLKVPKREIFDRSDFPDCYTIKSLRVGDFGVKIKKILKYFGGHLGVQSSLRTCSLLSLFLRRFFFLSFGQKKFFSVELLRPLVSVNNDFLKISFLRYLKNY